VILLDLSLILRNKLQNNIDKGEGNKNKMSVLFHANFSSIQARKISRVIKVSKRNWREKVKSNEER